MNEYVVLKGKKDRLVIELNKDIEFDALVKKFSQKIKQAKSVIGNIDIAIEFTNRKLSETEENILLEIINKESDIKITFIFSEQMPPKKHLLINQQKDITEEGITKFFKGTLRSGHSLVYNGNVVVLGDVNPGAIIKAKGNVIVLGYLNGTVYVGDDEGTDAFIGAFSLNPIQMKIGHIIAKNPSVNVLEVNQVKRSTDYEVAYAKDGKIFVEKFNKETLNKMIKI